MMQIIEKDNRKTSKIKISRTSGRNELGKAGDMQKVKMAAGIPPRLDDSYFLLVQNQILEQPRSTIDFDDIINSGKILICNFSKGIASVKTLLSYSALLCLPNYS